MTTRFMQPTCNRKILNISFAPNKSVSTAKLWDAQKTNPKPSSLSVRELHACITRHNTDNINMYVASSLIIIRALFLSYTRKLIVT